MMQYLALRGAPEMTPDCTKSDNGETDFDEFSHCLFHNFMTTSSDDMDLAISALDRDGNGEIDAQEQIKILTEISEEPYFQMELKGLI